MNERKVDCECHRPRDLAAGEFYGDVVRKQSSSQYTLSEIHHTCGRALPTHAHQAAYFSLLVEGRYSETYDGRRHDYEPLTVWWHRPGIVHQDAVGEGGGRFLNIEISREGTDALVEAGPARRDFFEKSTRAVWLACRLLRELRQWQPCSDLVAESLALEISECALRDFAPSRQPRWLDRVIQTLHDEPHRRHYTSTLARDAGVHPVHLASVFRRVHQQTIGEYVRTLRIRRATNLLRQKDVTLAEIAADLGFADQSHFTRVFGSTVGLSPSEFRRLLRPQ